MGGSPVRKSILILVAIAVLAATAITVAVIAGTSPAPGATFADVPVTVAHGAIVRLAGAILVIPPGAVSGDGQIKASTSDSQASTNLGLDGRPEARKPVFSPVGQSVSFELKGATLIHPATLSLPVNHAALARISPTGRLGVAWLASYEGTVQRWMPVHSRYDPSSGNVTAKVSHLSHWNLFTWDWPGMTLRLRQMLSAFGSGRAPKTDCTKVKGTSLTMTGGNDPPLLGCITRRDASGLAIDITNNRGYSMVLQPPPTAVRQSRDYSDFEAYLETSSQTTKAIGGAYLGSVQTVTYRLPPTGTTFKFTGAASWKTTVLDFAVITAEAFFDVVTVGYAKCILDNVSHSSAASLNEAPGLVAECLPTLNLGISLLKDITDFKTKVANILTYYDSAIDAVLKVHGQVTVVRHADWYNTSYTMTCAGIAPQPFTVNLQNGKGSAIGTGGYSSFEIHVEAVTQAGDLTGASSAVTAVLLYCTPQPSNFYVEEVQVFKADGSLLAELPPASTLKPSYSPLPPLYDSSQFSINAGQLVTGMNFYASTDSHAGGPSIHRVVMWRWNGRQFVHSPLNLPPAPASSCPAAGAGVPAGLVAAVKQQIGNGCGLIINHVRVDPNNQSWILFDISPTPGSLAQGGGGIAHEVNGVWPVVLTGSALFWCSPNVPAQVVGDFGLNCP